MVRGHRDRSGGDIAAGGVIHFLPSGGVALLRPDVPVCLMALRRDGIPLHPTTLGGRLRKRRAELNLTQAEVALRLGVSQGHLCNWEKGRREPEASKREAVRMYLEGGS
jgi:DNA-binding XRE family transcriptional regulator